MPPKKTAPITPAPGDAISITGAREHNLKDLSVAIPRDQLVVITGLSGSGKSSLAFDTLYAEGQRRYVESLSAYARQFLGQMHKPDVDSIEGLSPAIAIDQKTTSKNPRSTVATVTEIYDYLRLLWARAGVAHCPVCDRAIAGQSPEQITEQVLSLEEGTRFLVLAPLVERRKGEHRELLQSLQEEGFARVRIDGEVHLLEDAPALKKTHAHTIELVVDRLVAAPDLRRRLSESIETATRHADGAVRILTLDEDGGDGTLVSYSEHFACPEHGSALSSMEPRIFSFNSPEGACTACQGLGFHAEVDPELVVAKERALDDGAILPWADRTTDYYGAMLDALAEVYDIDLAVPFGQLPREQRDLILHGPPGGHVALQIPVQSGGRARRRRKRSADGMQTTYFIGVVPQMERQYGYTASDGMREKIEQFMTPVACSQCDGTRLRPEVRAVRIDGQGIDAFVQLSVAQAKQRMDTLTLTDTQARIAGRVVAEVQARLDFLVDVGLDYLTLDRAAGTLSGGEAQRIRLATQIGSGLMGVLYILDEPSIGLHHRDNERLIATLERLRDGGNTVIVVEHDEELMRRADHLIDIGPGAGEHGGHIVAQGTPAEVATSKDSITGAFLSGRREIAVPDERREATGHLTVVGASENNLRDVDVQIPLGVMCAVTGVSGSGKSSLVNEVVLKALRSRIGRVPVRPGAHQRIDGLDQIDAVIAIDQAPIGRTPRSNPATYTSVFDHIRSLFAKTKDARARGWAPGRFSFNVKGGRCEACKGDGTLKIEMHFLPDVYVECEVCKGARYNAETLDVRYGGHTIAEVLQMPVEEALDAFTAVPPLRRRLQTLLDVGLGYVRLGQPATTLSGGEAQRVKLASELAKMGKGHTLYVLDEPTTGLHAADVERLLLVLQRLVDAGNTVLVIEHNLDVIKCADWIIDMGPEGGGAGGIVVAEGTPEHVAAAGESHTGQALAGVLGRP